MRMYEEDSVIKRWIQGSKKRKELTNKALFFRKMMSTEDLEICQEKILLDISSKIEQEVTAYAKTMEEAMLCDNWFEDLEKALKRLIEKFDIVDNERDSEFMKKFTSKVLELLKIVIDTKDFTL